MLRIFNFKIKTRCRGKRFIFEWVIFCDKKLAKIKRKFPIFKTSLNYNISLNNWRILKS